MYPHLIKIIPHPLLLPAHLTVLPSLLHAMHSPLHLPSPTLPGNHTFPWFVIPLYPGGRPILWCSLLLLIWQRKSAEVTPTAPTIAGPRETLTSMYLVNLKKITNTVPPFSNIPNHTINHVYDMHTKVDLVTYLHLCVWSPVVDTWLKAIDCSAYLTWPGLSSQPIKKIFQN